jgi:hypothetical protein
MSLACRSRRDAGSPGYRHRREPGLRGGAGDDGAHAAPKPRRRRRGSRRRSHPSSGRRTLIRRQELRDRVGLRRHLPHSRWSDPSARFGFGGGDEEDLTTAAHPKEVKWEGREGERRVVTSPKVVSFNCTSYQTRAH